MNTLQNSCPLIPSQKGSHWVGTAQLHQVHQGNAARASLLTLLSLLQILLAGGLEDYEGNRVCFPTITSPRYKRLSKKNWHEGRYQWLNMFSLAFRTLFFQGLRFSAIFSPVNCVWAGRATHRLQSISAPYSNELTNYLLYLKPGLNTW